MIRLPATTGLAMALTAIALFTLPAARAGDAREIAGQAIYNMLGAALVEGATHSDDVPDYLKPDDHLAVQADDIHILTSIPSEKYAVSDALSNQRFSPAEGVTCYPKQGLCFKKSGKPDLKWTNRIYRY